MPSFGIFWGVFGGTGLLLLTAAAVTVPLRRRRRREAGIQAVAEIGKETFGHVFSPGEADPRNYVTWPGDDDPREEVA